MRAANVLSRLQEIRFFDGPIANLKVKRLGDGTIALACSAPATPAGHMYSPAAKKRPYSSGMVYTSLFVRHWDSYVTANTNAIWYGSLRQQRSDGSGGGGYALAEPGLVNALAGSRLQSPVPPFGGTGDFDIGPRGLVFVARDPGLSDATHTKSEVYFVPLRTFAETKPPAPQMVKTGRLLGYAGSPVFSPDGQKLAFTKMRDRQYESDKTRLMLVPDIDDLSNVQEFYETADGEGSWDARPTGIVWSTDGSELYVSADKHARGMLWKLPSTPLAAGKTLPECISSEGTVADFRPLGERDSRLFLSTTSLVDSSSYVVLDPVNGTRRLVSSSSKEGRTFGLSRTQYSDIWFPGADDAYAVHALVIRPSDFDESRTYPLALLIHGGPQDAWTDSWSTRWNPAVFAEQGYVVVAPNPTGSMGYGMALENGIRGQWGGRPYRDLEKCFEYVAEKLPYVDTSRAVALGASYGGYMISRFWWESMLDVKGKG